MYKSLFEQLSMHVPDQYVRANARAAFSRGDGRGFRGALKKVANTNLRTKLAQVYDAHQAHRVGRLARSESRLPALSMSTMAPRVRTTKATVLRHDAIAKTLQGRRHYTERR